MMPMTRWMVVIGVAGLGCAGAPLMPDADPLPNTPAVSGDVPSTGTPFETDVLRLVNAARAAGAVCGGTDYPPVAPLNGSAILQTVAQAHSDDMIARGFFDHTNPDGDGPGERLDDAAYDYRTWGENIALGQSSPDAVMDSWLASPGHCRNIMNESFAELGVGHNAGSAWTQVFATPR